MKKFGYILAALFVLVINTLGAAEASKIETSNQVNFALVWITALTPIVIMGIKKYAPMVPTHFMPWLAPLIGAALEISTNFADLSIGGVFGGAMFGALGVWLREAQDQLKYVKPKIETAAKLLVCVLGLFMLPGCTTTSTGQKIISENAADKIAPILAATSASAVVYAYNKDPNSALYISAVRACLFEFLESTNLSVTDLQAKLSNMPIKELKTVEAQLIIAPVLAMYKAFGDQLLKNGYSGNTDLKILVRALIDGVGMGLQTIGQTQSEAKTYAYPQGPQDKYQELIDELLKKYRDSEYDKMPQLNPHPMHYITTNNVILTPNTYLTR